MDGMANQGAPKINNDSQTNRVNIGGNKVNNHQHEPNWASKILVVALIVLSLVVVLSLAPAAFSNTKNTVSLTKDGQYQAVFLNNGQVYFGKLSSLNSEYVVLKDIYYLQINQQVQPRQGQQAQEEAPEVELVKLGNELHGPEDEMFIVRDKIVFWENLKTDGQVAEAIASFQSGETNQENPDVNNDESN